MGHALGFLRFIATLETFASKKEPSILPCGFALSLCKTSSMVEMFESVQAPV